MIIVIPITCEILHFYQNAGHEHSPETKVLYVTALSARLQEFCRGWLGNLGFARDQR